MYSILVLEISALMADLTVDPANDAAGSDSAYDSEL